MNALGYGNKSLVSSDTKEYYRFDPNYHLYTISNNEIVYITGNEGGSIMNSVVYSSAEVMDYMTHKNRNKSHTIVCVFMFVRVYGIRMIFQIFDL